MLYYLAGMMDTFAIEEFEQLTHMKFEDKDILDLSAKTHE